jgi:hypothetical protein
MVSDVVYVGDGVYLCSGFIGSGKFKFIGMNNKIKLTFHLFVYSTVVLKLAVS